MMKQQWEKISGKLNAMSQRERVMIFSVLVVFFVSMTNALLLDPLSARQKILHSQLLQQQQQLSEVQSRINIVLQESSPNSTSPQRVQINRIRQELAEGDLFLKSSRERLVQPDKMAGHLRQLLRKNGRLQLVSMQTLPVTPLIEVSEEDANEKNQKSQAAAVTLENQVYKHGVELTLRGNYLDLMQYLSALEKLPQQMYWARVEMKVKQYPGTELTLILYTLSLDKTWLRV